ncbi:HlyC/CorC family transporter [Xinfangfangia sp. D13-10-4-6]|uniref:hemolysin family protein n=1 Tax=Pseudogemmobacter hezensis TaxID=2737662 RepID=UPI001555F4C6|nr:hemolysin family protein [Pseudogemmobacter hezensis]NPD13784.1 HlyC/CorC family transporter [Pseudogemmobacter hezensis]
MVIEILILLALIVLNGVFAMSELAVVSSRPARLKSLAASSRGAAQALRLAENPGRFLSTVQIGITGVGVLSGALAGDTLGGRIAEWLIQQGMGPAWASRIGVGGAVIAITYVSLIVGELVPKQVALRNPEAVAIRVAPMMAALSVVAAPVVWFLDRSGKLVLRLLGQQDEGENRVTEEEVNVLLTEAQAGGVLEKEERAMISGVMRLSDRTVRALMTPRQDVASLPVDIDPALIPARVSEIGHSRIPVANAAGDVLGVVRVSDLYAAIAHGEAADLTRLLRQIPVISDRMEALDVVAVLQKATEHMALVYDEYGAFEGLVTQSDLIEAITGAEAAADKNEPAIFPRADGSLLVAGWMPADEFCDRMGLPRDMAGGYDTVAGLVLYQLGHMAGLGETFTLAAGDGSSLEFEVMDLDGLRIDKVLVTQHFTPD